MPLLPTRHRAGGGGGGGGSPSGPPREPLEVQLELLDLWHAGLVRLLRTFKTRFRSAGAAGAASGWGVGGGVDTQPKPNRTQCRRARRRQWPCFDNGVALDRGGTGFALEGGLPSVSYRIRATWGVCCRHPACNGMGA